jgi:hypothetical protein
MEGSLVAYKVFTNGSVLNASEVNENLMNQAVITFSNSTARSSAITTPVEGMITYLEDSNSYQSWDGSAWVGLVPQSGNAIINGGFDIWQRGSSFTGVPTAYFFTADRWEALAWTGSTSSVSRQTFTPGSAPVAGYEGQFFLSYSTTDTVVGNTLLQKIEDVRTLAGQNFTVSFWAKVASGTPAVAVQLVQNFGTGGSGEVGTSLTEVPQDLSTSWQRFTASGTLPSVSGKTIGANSHLRLAIGVPSGNNTLDIWGVQLEAGSVATPFKRNANSLQGELAACQRYYFRFTGPAAFSAYGQGGFGSTVNGYVSIDYPVTLRNQPSSVDFGNLAVQDLAAGSPLAVTALTLDQTSLKTASLSFVVASGGTAHRPVRILNNNNVAGFLGLSAEL